MSIEEELKRAEELAQVIWEARRNVEGNFDKYTWKSQPDIVKGAWIAVARLVLSSKPSTRLTQVELQTLRAARADLRDLTIGWPEKELCRPPRIIVHELTNMIGDYYDFNMGDVSLSRKRNQPGYSEDGEDFVPSGPDYKGGRGRL